MYDMNIDLLKHMQDMRVLHKQYIETTHKKIAYYRAISMLLIPCAVVILYQSTALSNTRAEAEALRGLVHKCMSSKPGAYSLLDDDGTAEDYMCYSVHTGTRREVKK